MSDNVYLSSLRILFFAKWKNVSFPRTYIHNDLNQIETTEFSQQSDFGSTQAVFLSQNQGSSKAKESLLEMANSSELSKFLKI